MNLITGAKGSAHITPAQDAHWHRGIVGTGTCIFETGERFAPEVVTNNRIKIKDGVGMIQGRMFNIDPSTYDEVTLDNGSQGYNRIDLIVAEITVNSGAGTQSIAYKVVKGTPSASTPVVPTYTSGNLDNGDLTAGIVLAKVTLTGINVTACESVADVSKSIYTLSNDLSEILIKKRFEIAKNVQVAANSTVSFSADFQGITGYTPVSIAGWCVFNSESGGAQSSAINIYGLDLYRSDNLNQVRALGRNMLTGTAAKVDMTVDVLFCKTQFAKLLV